MAEHLAQRRRRMVTTRSRRRDPGCVRCVLHLPVRTARPRTTRGYTKASIAGSHAFKLLCAFGQGLIQAHHGASKKRVFVVCFVSGAPRADALSPYVNTAISRLQGRASPVQDPSARRNQDCSLVWACVQATIAAVIQSVRRCSGRPRSGDEPVHAFSTGKSDYCVECRVHCNDRGPCLWRRGVAKRNSGTKARHNRAPAQLAQQVGSERRGRVTVTENWRNGVEQCTKEAGAAAKHSQAPGFANVFLIDGAWSTDLPAARGFGPYRAVPFRAGQSALPGWSSGLPATRRRRATTASAVQHNDESERYCEQAEGAREG